MTAKVILNPYAGRWLALKRKAEIVSALDEAGVDFELLAGMEFSFIPKPKKT